MNYGIKFLYNVYFKINDNICKNTEIAIKIKYKGFGVNVMRCLMIYILWEIVI